MLQEEELKKRAIAHRARGKNPNPQQTTIIQSARRRRGSEPRQRSCIAPFDGYPRRGKQVSNVEDSGVE